MRLATTEGGLQFHDRLTTRFLAPSPKGFHDQFAQSGSQKGPAEEFAGIAIFGRRIAFVDLPQVGRELGLHVVSTRHVWMRHDHIPPRLQARWRRAFDRLISLFPALVIYLPVEARASELVLHLVGRLRLFD